MDQIDAFVNRIPDWLDETGALAEPDLDVLRELLECRAAVLGHTDPLSWPEGSLVETVMGIAPFVLRFDASWRAAAAVTLPVLRDVVVFEGDRESAEVLRREVKSLHPVLTGGAGERMQDAFGWSTVRRLHHLTTGTDVDAWLARYKELSWEEADRLAGPLRRGEVSLGGDPYGGVTIPSPRLVLPSVAGAAAQQAPLVSAAVELALWLVAQPSVGASGVLDDDTVAQALSATTLGDAAAVQEAWRIAVLSELVYWTGAHVLRGPRLTAWADPGSRPASWDHLVRAVVGDVPASDRDEVMAAVYAAYHPGLPAGFDESLSSEPVRIAVDRLRRLGMFDDSGTKLSPLGVQGVLLPWLRIDRPGRWPLVAGPWRPEMTTADVRAWIAASMRRMVADAEGQSWMRTAEPVAFAHQLVDVLVASDDPVERATAFILLTQLGSQVTPVADRLAGTRLHGYRTMWPGAAPAAEPDQAQLLLFLRDQLAWQDALSAEAAELRPGVQIDLGRFDFGGPWPDWFRERIGRPGPLTEAELAVLRETLATDRAELAAAVAQISAE
ncbi:hypothetical protein GCM10009745_45320 [Kribbella yunnanensis]|uniref:Uncharacterized protein n=1 Tax=Kribbella yunnanensis TaxID=190194 RepID=A0ABN2HW95_9ACTN